MSSRCLWNRRHEGAGPTFPPRRAVMWGMEQMPAALAQKQKHVIRSRGDRPVAPTFFCAGDCFASLASARGAMTTNSKRTTEKGRIH